MLNDNVNVIDFLALKNKRGTVSHDSEYQEQINRMSWIELLEAMVQFQEDRSTDEDFNLTTMSRGLILFRALEKCCMTPEMQSLASAYSRHLECEIEIVRKQMDGVAKQTY